MQPWDSFDAYLFDLDGTLLHCNDAVHYFGFCKALRYISGRPLDLHGVVAHGNTDLGILRDALTLAGIDASLWRPMLKAGVAVMEEFVKAREQDMVVQQLPGAADVLSHLLKKRAALGVATGNLALIGNMKLRLAQLDSYFGCHGFSDGLESREGVFKHALQQMRAAHPGVTTVCVVGDTPRDIQAARVIGAAAIGVAGGVFGMAELLAENPDYCANSLSALMQTADVLS